MTPAAPPFETLLPKARFRNIQRVFETIPATVIGTKKSPKMKIESRKLLQSLCQGMESCEEEDDHSPRRAHSFHRMDSKDGTPSTSSRCFGDSHFEISDEDRDICSSRRETVKKTEPGGSERCREMKGDEHFLKEECIESILDDRYPFLDGNNRRNYYIIRSDGRLAEVFRTDLFDRLRKGINTNDESDDDDIPGSGLARMSDRWRAEWTNGIQIPLRANNPNPSEIRKAVVKRMTSRISRTLQKRRELLSEFYANAYEPIQATTLRLYECTILDELWVKLLNEQRTRTNSSLLPMETFLEIMNEFEIECYKNIHRKLLEPLHSPSSRIEDGDEEAACDICSAVDSEPDDEMVFCDGCNLCVHMSCYGLQELPPDEWLCMKCRLCFGECSICDTRQGACIKCSVGSCMSSFHATCALRSGLEMRIESDPVDDRVHMISLCPRHRSAKPFAKDEAVCESSQAASDEETAGNYDSGPLAKLEQTFYDFVDHAAIAVKLELDPSLVADVFSYWVKKRLQLNKGKPLIENLQDEIKIVQPEPPQLELPVYTESNSHLPASPEPVKRKRGRPRKNPVDPSVVPLTPKPVTVAKETLRKMEWLLHSLYGKNRLLCMQ
ncbi:PHD-finger [Cooperia oncophora]